MPAFIAMADAMRSAVSCSSSVQPLAVVMLSSFLIRSSVGLVIAAVLQMKAKTRRVEARKTQAHMVRR